MADDALLREYLRIGQFWFLDGLFAALVASSAWAGRDLIRTLTPSDRRMLAVVTCVAALLVLLAPRTNRIFYDEHIYQAIGQNLSDLHLAQMCNDGTVEYGALQCWQPEYNKQPYGYPHLLSIGFRLLGTSDTFAQRLNVIVSGLSAGAVFLLTLVLTRERVAAGFAALAFMLLPEQLRWSHTAAVEPSAALAGTLAMLATLTFVTSRSTASLVWMVVASSWATYFRPEAVLILPVIAVTLLLHARSELTRPRFLWLLAIWALLLLPTVAHLLAVRNENWGSTEARFSLPFFWHNLQTNTAFYLGDQRFPMAVTLLALAGLGLSRAPAVLAIWFGAFWAVFLFFYAGSYDYGADVRYSLMSHAPLAALAGIGTFRLVRLSSAAFTRQGAMAIAVAALLFQSTWYLPWVRSVGEEAWGARMDVAFARDTATTLPPNAIVLTHNPGMFHLWGVNAAQLSMATSDPAYVRDTLPRRYAGGVYLHWNFWCNVSDKLQRDFCDQALESFPTELIREERVRDYRFAFYKVSDGGMRTEH